MMFCRGARMLEAQTRCGVEFFGPRKRRCSLPNTMLVVQARQLARAKQQQ